MAAMGGTVGWHAAAGSGAASTRREGGDGEGRACEVEWMIYMRALATDVLKGHVCKICTALLSKWLCPGIHWFPAVGGATAALLEA